MRVPIGLLILAVSSSAYAAGQGEPMDLFITPLKFAAALGGLVVALTSARWLYSWYQRRKATIAATRAVKERVGRGQKPYP